MAVFLNRFAHPPLHKLYRTDLKFHWTRPRRSVSLCYSNHSFSIFSSLVLNDPKLAGKCKLSNRIEMNLLTVEAWHKKRLNLEGKEKMVLDGNQLFLQAPILWKIFYDPRTLRIIRDSVVKNPRD